MIRALFVDDELAVLEGLENRLRPLRGTWQMRFVLGAEEAMASLALEPADIIITDMRMPGMDGADLLRRVRDRWPATVRLILSGQIGQDGMMRALPVAHQFLTKPCNLGLLQEVVERSCALQARIYSGGVRAAICSLASLPSLPKFCQQLNADLDSGHASPKSVAKIIEQDVAMTARLLQFVNSAYFGSIRRISNVRDAVTFIGFDTVRNLAASTEMFRGMAKMCLPRGLSLEEVQRHSLRVGNLAASLLTDPDERRTAFCASILHDIGEVMLAVSMPDAFERSRAIARQRQVTVHAAEQEIFQCTHAEIGAHVLALWGLPAPLVEAVALHHQPGLVPLQTFGVVGAIHVAEAILTAQESGGALTAQSLTDNAYLHRVGRLEALAGWVADAAKMPEAV